MRFFFSSIYRLVICVLLALVMNACSSADLRNEDDALEIQYVVESMGEAAHPMLKVKLRFRLPSTGELKVVMPTDLDDKKKSLPGVRNFNVLTANVLVTDADSEIKILRAAPGEKVDLQYTVEQVTGRQDPVIQSDYFYFAGSMLAHPDFGDRVLRIDMTWKVPKSWQIANSYGDGNTHQQFRGFFHEGPVEDVGQAVFAAGDLRVHKIMIHNHPVSFATRGHWLMSDDVFVGATEDIIRTQREFWNDFDVPYYFVLLLPNGKPCCTRSGRGLTHSFVTQLSEEEYSLERFTLVLAHEHFHYWNGEKMSPESGSSEVWFTEGFTDYYARVLNFRGGISSYDEFVDGLNSAIYRYYENPARTADDDRIKKEFSTDNNVQNIPYAKGNLVGIEWNFAIRNATKNQKSLDDFMKSVYDESRTYGLIKKDRLRSALRQLVGTDLAERMMKSALDGSLISPSDGALGPCAHVEEETMGRLEYGYDRYPTSHIASKVKPGKASYEAGLRKWRRDSG